MDPNATLLQLRALANKIMKDYDNPNGNGVDQDEANALAEMITNLDNHIKNGGMPPLPWWKK